MQRFKDESLTPEYKDIDELLDEGYINSDVKKLGIEFMTFVDGFYDLDGNYTDDGLSSVGFSTLKRYEEKYNYTCQ